MSPVPTLEQDYTRVVEWMDGLRVDGVHSIRDYFDRDIERVRDAAEKIVNVAVNPAAVEVIGLPEEAVTGPVDRDIVNPEALDAWIEQFEVVWAGRNRSVTTFPAAHASGERFDAKRTIAIPDGPHGPDYTRAVMTIEDITEQRDEERRMHGEMQSRTRFLASVSHEIRTPLTGILGFAEVLSESPELFSEADTARIITSIFEQAKDLSAIVDDLLLTAQGDIGSLSMADEPIDVIEEITGVLETGASFTDSVTWNRSQPSTIAQGDAGRFRQILRNLLTNAERYGGSDVAVGVSRSGGMVVIDVSDDGDGVPDEMAEEIFEPYRRGHSHGASPESVGVGLAICRQFAGLMSGTLDYQRVAGRSRFRLAIPAGPAHE